MKKRYLFIVLLALAFILLPFIAFAQIYSPTWGTSGNTVKTGQFFGSKNSQDVIFKTNNANILNLKANGDIIFPNLTNSVTGKYLTTDANGKLQLASATNYDDVLTFNTLSAFPATGTNGILYIASDTGNTYIWNNTSYTQTATSPSTASTAWYVQNSTIDAGSSKISNIYRTGRIGIGTSSPQNNIDIVGGINIRSTAGNNGTGYGMEFWTNSNSPRIDWVANGAYVGQFSSNNADFFLKNSLNNTGNIRFTTKSGGSGKERLTILNSGNIGIGTATPLSLLHLLTTSSARLLFETSDGSSGQASIDLKNGTYQHWRMIGQGSANGGRYDIHNQNLNAPAMSIMPNNNIGINTTNPVTRFVVNDNNYISAIPATNAQLMNNTTYRPLSRLQITSGANNNAISSYLTTTTGAIQVHNYSTGATLPLLINTAGGNVGIGLNNPSYALDVKGTIQADGIKFTNLIPTANNDAGVTGEIRVSEEYIYVCIFPNKWRRVAISDF